MALGPVLPASVDSASVGTQTVSPTLATAEDPLTASARQQSQAVQVAELPPSKYMTSAMQTDGHPNRCLAEPVALVQVTTASQTEDEGNQQLLLAQQGRLPLTKANSRICQHVASLINRATKKARDGLVLSAERELCLVSTYNPSSLCCPEYLLTVNGFHFAI